jgi:thiamine monophosphate kinase
LDDALYGGEDYQLVLACPDTGRLLEAFAAASLDSPVRIGTCVADAGEHSLRGAPLPPGGWEHRFAPSFRSPVSGGDPPA